MNPLRLLAFFSLLAVAGQAASPTENSAGSPPTATKAAVNYTIRVGWQDVKNGTNALQVVTGEGSVELDTIAGAVKINDSDVPTTVKFNATITELTPEQGRLQMFLGRTVPYVTSSFGGPGAMKSSSYSQLSVGLQSTFIVTFGKPLIIQTDGNGEVSVLVKRDGR